MTVRFCFSAAALVTIAALVSACSKSPTAPSAAPTATAAQPAQPAPPAPAPPPPSRSPAATFSNTTVSFTSDAAHYVGQGRSLTLTMQNATFEPSVYNNGGNLLVQMRVKDATSFWGFRVMTPGFAATPIVPGTYDTARDPLLPAWFFEFYGDARNCSNTARLVIHAIEFTPDRQALKNFRASFQDHHCNGASPSMQGEIAILADPWR